MSKIISGYDEYLLKLCLNYRKINLNPNINNKYIHIQIAQIPKIYTNYKAQYNFNMFKKLNQISA
jgi:hypothetical protein